MSQPVLRAIMSYLDYTNAFVAGMDHDRGRRLQRMHAHQLVSVHRLGTIRCGSMLPMCVAHA